MRLSDIFNPVNYLLSSGGDEIILDNKFSMGEHPSFVKINYVLRLETINPI